MDGWRIREAGKRLRIEVGTRRRAALQSVCEAKQIVGSLGGRRNGDGGRRCGCLPQGCRVGRLREAWRGGCVREDPSGLRRKGCQALRSYAAAKDGGTA